MKLSPENIKWISEFGEKYGRPPRVLHIGNIANNAYNNAKLLIDAGLDNDVICYDYYHMMACPEWEDADLSDPVDNDFRPNWSSLNTGGFRRPNWFVQGPQKDCIDYLLARFAGHSAEAKTLWQSISIINQTYHPPGFAQRVYVGYCAGFTRVKEQLVRVYRLGQSNPIDVFTRLIGKSYSYSRPLAVALASLLMLVWAFLSAGSSVALKILKAVGFFSGIPTAKCDVGLFENRVNLLVSAWAQSFPERMDVLVKGDLTMYRSIIEHWRQLFSHYDIVIGYSTDGVLPLLTDTPFFAFEHGTIREIPYQSTTQGRNAAMTYRNAKHVFVTNFDCLPSAKNLAPDRHTVINHPYDEDHGDNVAGWQALRQFLRSSLDSDLICFFPTRHDWVPNTGYADKSNDIFLLALADLRRAGFRVGAVCCEWGANVSQSKMLIANHDLEPYVMWERPMAMMKFERMARACDLVVDQFKLGAFGGIVFKAMAVGAPILTYLDVDRLLVQYEEIPPVINCASQKCIVEKMIPLVMKPDCLTKIGEESRAWIKKFHAKEDTVNFQLNQFRKTTAKSPVALI